MLNPVLLRYESVHSLLGRPLKKTVSQCSATSPRFADHKGERGHGGLDNRTRIWPWVGWFGRSIKI